MKENMYTSTDTLSILFAEISLNGPFRELEIWYKKLKWILYIWTTFKIIVKYLEEG